MANSPRTIFESKLDQLGHYYNIDKSAVQKSKEGIFYKLTEIITEFINRLWGDDSVQKARILLSGRVSAIASPADPAFPLEAALKAKIYSMKTKYPDLEEMLNQELQEIHILLKDLGDQFEKERESLENSLKRGKSDIQQHRSNIQEMAKKFLEFEEGLKLVDLTTDQILLPGLKMQLKEKFDKINQNSSLLNKDFWTNINLIDNVKEFNQAVLILNKIEQHSNELETYFTAQDKKLEGLNVPKSVRDTIRNEQNAHWVKMVREIAHTNQISELENNYKNLLHIWNNEGLLGVASSHLAKETETEVSQLVDAIENNVFKQKVRGAADTLLKETLDETTDISKIVYLNSLNEVLLDNMQNFLKEEVETLQPLFVKFEQKLTEELGLDPLRKKEWTDEIKKTLNNQISVLKDVSDVNRFLQDVNRVKEQKMVDHLLTPEKQKGLHNQRKNLEVFNNLKALEAKFPKQHMKSMIEFLGDKVKGSLLAEIASSLTIASNSDYTREEKEKMILKINAIPEDKLIQELKVNVRKKADELFLAKGRDIEKLALDNQHYLLSYPWIAKEAEANLEIQKCVDLILSVDAPEINDLDNQSTFLKLSTYTERVLINPEKIVQKKYKTAKADALNSYSNWLEEQIRTKLNNTLLPVYQGVTKDADLSKEKENFSVYQDFVRDKANEMKDLIMRSPHVQTELVDLTRIGLGLKDELKEKLESFNPIDYVFKAFGDLFQ